MKRAGLRRTLAMALAATFLSGGAQAADRLTIWDLKIGTPVAEMPPWIAFKGYACGSNGGPPMLPLSGWEDYVQCGAEPDGLHEVYFEYDDEEEYIRRAHDDMRLAQVVGTTDRSFPIITSALFNDDGILKGLRVVTDPRQNIETDNEAADLRERNTHFVYGSLLAAQWGIDRESDCREIPAAEGETPVARSFLKLDCEREDAEAGVRYLLAVRHLRKPGHRARDPRTGVLTTGDYESLTYAEVLAVDVPVTDSDLPQ